MERGFFFDKRIRIFCSFFLFFISFSMNWENGLNRDRIVVMRYLGGGGGGGGFQFVFAINSFLVNRCIGFC
jgi:hypothetical protein